MSKSYPQAKGRGKGHSFLMLPHYMMKSENFQSLGGKSLRLLLDLGAQYNGHNNGDLSAAKKILEKRGWTSNDSIQKAKTELLDKGWIIETRKGGLGLGCSLYALSWFAIDECKGKLEISATTNVPNTWKEWQSLSKSPHRVTVQSAPNRGTREGKKVVPLHR